MTATETETQQAGLDGRWRVWTTSRFAVWARIEFRLETLFGIHFREDHDLLLGFMPGLRLHVCWTRLP